MMEHGDGELVEVIFDLRPPPGVSQPPFWFSIQQKQMHTEVSSTLDGCSALLLAAAPAA